MTWTGSNGQRQESGAGNRPRPCREAAGRKEGTNAFGPTWLSLLLFCHFTRDAGSPRENVTQTGA